MNRIRIGVILGIGLLVSPGTISGRAGRFPLSLAGEGAHSITSPSTPARQTDNLKTRLDRSVEPTQSEAERNRCVEAGRKIYREKQLLLTDVSRDLSEDMRRAARFQETSPNVSMTQLQEFCELIPAKHLYFIIDSCYSGLALTRSGAAPSGIRSRHKAMQLDPQRAIAYLNFADAYVRVGKPTDASQNYEKYLQLAPNAANADEIRRIAELQNKQ